MNKILAQFKSKSGFTLIELIIAIVIVVILTTIGVASFNSASRANAVQQQAQEIKSLARKLRTDASAAVKPSSCATPGSFYGTYINFQEGSGTISYGTSCWQDSTNDESPTASTKNLATGITVRTVSTSTNLTIFYNFDGKVFVFDCATSCASGNNINIAPTQTEIGSATASVSVENIVITDTEPTRDYRINFSPTGLVCEEKDSIPSVCAGP